MSFALPRTRLRALATLGVGLRRSWDSPPKEGGSSRPMWWVGGLTGVVMRWANGSNGGQPLDRQGGSQGGF